MIVGKLWMQQDEIKARTDGERVFWDRFWGRCNMGNPSSANSMINRDTISDKEVLATLSGLQYQESQRSFCLEVLKSDISRHLLSMLPQDIKNQYTNPSFTLSTHWHHHSIQGQVQLHCVGKVGLCQLGGLECEAIWKLGLH